MAVRKVLEKEDEVLTIYDEIRDKPGTKGQNRFANDPVYIHKLGDGTEEKEEEDEQETIEII